jgi:hypothetical protein
MASLGPIDVLGGAADTQEWAHCVCSRPLPMTSLGPINILGRAADSQE